MESADPQQTSPEPADPLAAAWIRFRQAPDGRLLEVDGLLAPRTGISIKSWLAASDPFWAWIHESDRERVRDVLRREVSAEWQPFSFRVRHPVTGRVGWWREWRRSRGDHHEGWWLDQSLPHRLYRHLESTQGQGVLSDLLPGYVHDLNNALTGILSLAELCQIQASEAPGLEGPLRQVHQNATRMRQLLQGLARLHAALEVPAVDAVQWHDLNQLCREVADLARPGLSSRTALECVLAEVPLPVIGRGAPLRFGLYHLLVNAERALHGMGTVRVETAVTDPPPGTVSVGPFGQVTVSDTGPGFTETLAEEALLLEGTTRPGRGGIGSGLHFLARTVQSMGGVFSLQPLPEGGTAVTFSLPLADEGREWPDRPGSQRHRPLVCIDLTGQGTGALTQRLHGIGLPILCLPGPVERVLAGAELDVMEWVLWGGEGGEAVQRQLDRLDRVRLRPRVFLIMAEAGWDPSLKRPSVAEEWCSLETPDLCERVVRWRSTE